MAYSHLVSESNAYDDLMDGRWENNRQAFTLSMTSTRKIISGATG
jgi:hypothetical protein